MAQQKRKPRAVLGHLTSATETDLKRLHIRGEPSHAPGSVFRRRTESSPRDGGSHHARRAPREAVIASLSVSLGCLAFVLYDFLDIDSVQRLEQHIAVMKAEWMEQVGQQETPLKRSS